MFRKMIYLVTFAALLLVLMGNVQAAVVNWNGSADPFWSTPDNWDGGSIPASADTASIGIVPGPVIASEGIVADIIWVGAGRSAADLTVDGGTLTTNKWVIVGINTGSNGTINMKSGSFTINSTLLLGDREEGTGHVNLDGGILTVNNLEMRRGSDTVGTLDVQAGTLIVNGDADSTIQEYIDNGWITAYDGYGTLQLDYDVTNGGQTTLTAIHNLKPNPANSGTTAPGEVELSWTLPEPSVPGIPVQVDVYFTDDLQLLEQFTDPEAIQVVNKQSVSSVVVQTQPKTQYYWAIDTYIGDPNDPIFGPIFSFIADNMPPQVDAGSDIVTWLAEGVRAGSLDATVTDIDAYTVQWTVVSEPNEGTAVIETATAEDTSVTLSAVGEYVLQLEASDGEYSTSDTVTINVYNDGCEAAQSMPDYVPLPGDVNGDCIFDQLDLDILNEDWLKDVSLTEEWSTVN